MTTALIAQPDSAVLDEFLGRMIGDLGATVSAGLVVIGDRLGLYKAMAAGEPVTPEQLASRTGTAIAYVRPWLANQAAGGYLSYQPKSGTFSLSPEQAAARPCRSVPAPPRLAHHKVSQRFHQRFDNAATTMPANA